MRIFVTGGTGFIGSAVVRALIARNHYVTGLARSDDAVRSLTANGATPIAGDISAPEAWIARLPNVDAVIHMACDFASDMGAVERHLLDVLLPSLAAQSEKVRLIYTGGCWLFGQTGDVVASQRDDLHPLQAFAWMVPHTQRIAAAENIHGIVLHPAMAYERAGGVFRRFADEASKLEAVRVVGSEAVNWPLVHRDDLAALYCLTLERAPAGSSYIGAAIEGVPVGQIARAFSRHFGGPLEPTIVSPDEIAAEMGEWARGYALNQRLSGAKARQELGWEPTHLDPLAEIAAGA